MFREMYEQLRLGTPLLVIGHSLRDEAILDILLSVADEFSEKRKRGSESKFKILLMNPNADKIMSKNRLKQIREVITPCPYKFGTERGFQELSSSLDRFFGLKDQTRTF